MPRLTIIGGMSDRDTSPPKLRSLPLRVKYARARAGMTARALAKRSEMTPSQISRIETGDRVRGIEAATVLRLAEALGVPAGWLLADEGTLPPVPVFSDEASLGDRRRRKPGSR